MYFKLAFFFLTAGLALVSADDITTPVIKCKGVAEDLFQSVVVTTHKGVCTKLPCDFFLGRNVTAKIAFKVKDEILQITQKCKASAMGLTIEYPVPNAYDGCDLLTNTYCPVESDTDAELELNFYVEKYYPQMPVHLMFYLLDQDNNMLTCFELDTKLVKEKSQWWNSK